MNSIQTPHDLYGELFTAVQTAEIFTDSKVFVDALPRSSPEDIVASYRQQRDSAEFDLAAFVQRHFILPEMVAVNFKVDGQRPVREYIEKLWDILLRPADKNEPCSSLLPLPHSYIVPGGRYREIYYWDSYFTMLGLLESGRTGVAENMVANLACLIEQLGYMPNGNRSYYCGRSQQPTFALMVELLATHTRSHQVYTRFLPALEREYRFWMTGAEALTHDGEATQRVIKLGDGFLNRYWDDAPGPRQESYIEDVELAEHSDRDDTDVYRELRAACESGWDFSSRWLRDPMDLASIATSDSVPVDLNVLMYKLESILALACKDSGRESDVADFLQRAETRKGLLQTRFFDSKRGFYADLALSDMTPSRPLTMAAVYPLAFEVATPAQAKAVSKRLREDFLQPGGWVTTPVHSGQQWDAPNGWPPLQWLAYTGLQNYGYTEEANEGAQRWIDNNLQVYRETGCLMEKYNVENPGVLATGGEYEVQYGFGWTNAILLRLMNLLGVE